jgi:hypothetical protein
VGLLEYFAGAGISLPPTSITNVDLDPKAREYHESAKALEGVGFVQNTVANFL